MPEQEKQNMKKIQGLIAAVFTPFTENDQINPDVIPAYAARLKSQGVAGVFVNGSSGEGMLLSIAERKILADKWALEQEENFKVIVHVGSSSLEISKDLAVHAQSAGVFAIGCMAPNFFSSSDVNVIAAYCKEVALAAPDTLFYYYHLPVVTGAHIKVNHLFKIASSSIPNFAGVKFTYTDFMDMHQCIAFDNGRYDVLHGHDEILVNGLVLGVKGAIGTTFNFIPNVYHQIIAAYNAGKMEEACKYQMESIGVVEVMLKYVNAIVGGKAMMKISGLDCGPCRLPLRNLQATEINEMKAALQDTCFFDERQKAGVV